MSFTLAISKFRTPFKQNKWLWLFTVAFLAIWTNSLIGTTDISNWILQKISI